jgi:hypothetical protein
MWRLLIIPAFFWTVCLPLSAQNHVKNGSFNEYTKCPRGFGVGLPETLKYWRWPKVSSGNPEYSSDAYHECNPNENPRKTSFGGQAPISGKGTIGMKPWYDYNESREYAVGEIRPLRTGHRYQCGFFVSLGDDMQYAVGSMGMVIDSLLFERPWNMQQEHALSFLRYTVENPVNQLLTDTVGWTEIKGNYTAHGKEKYLLIGNIREDAFSNIKRICDYSCTRDASYYFVDSVYIIPIADTVFLRGDTTICRGDTATLWSAFSVTTHWALAQSPGVYFSHSDTVKLSPQKTTSYWLYGNTDSVFFTIHVADPEPPVIQGLDSICLGDTATWTIDAPYSQIYWMGNTVHSPSFRAGHPALYVAVTANICGSHTLLKRLHVDVPPQPLVLPAPVPPSCRGEVIQLSGFGNGYLRWHDGSTLEHLFTTDTAAVLYLSNACGAASLPVELPRHPLRADFALERNSGVAPFVVAAFNQSVGANAYTWLLDGKEVSQQADYADRNTNYGEHLLALAAQDAHGCRDTASRMFSVLRPDNLPPALCDFMLSPNPVRKEVTLSALNNDKQVKEIKIFDQHGRMIWQQNVEHIAENPFYYLLFTGDIAAGTYLIGLYCTDEHVLHKMVVVK